MAWYIAIHDHDISVTQHGLASYVTKFESQSFRLRSKFGVAFAQQESCWRSQQSAVCVSVCVSVCVEVEVEVGLAYTRIFRFRSV